MAPSWRPPIARYAAERDAVIADDGRSPRPSGGVGGTRRGVKCLHAHVAWSMAGGDDPVGRWALEHLELDLSGYIPEHGGGDAVAAIDCGTNSTRLLVVDGAGTSLERLMRITRLGEDVDATHRLAPEAMARTVAVLTEFGTRLDAHGVRRARLVATSAVRDAANAEEFLAGAEQRHRHRPRGAFRGGGRAPLLRRGDRPSSGRTGRPRTRPGGRHRRGFHRDLGRCRRRAVTAIWRRRRGACRRSRSTSGACAFPSASCTTTHLSHSELRPSAPRRRRGPHKRQGTPPGSPAGWGACGLGGDGVDVGGLVQGHRHL